MKKKDIAILKIIQYIDKRKKVSMSEIYSNFNFIPDGNGGYINKGIWPFDSRSLLRYVTELKENNIIKESEDKLFYINNEIFINSIEDDKSSLNKLLELLIENRELDLFEKINSISKNNKYEKEDYLNKLLNAIDIPCENINIDRDIEKSIKYAIANEKKVRVEYKKNKYRITPIAIVKNMNKNKKYLFFISKRKLAHPFELSNIKNVEIITNKELDRDKYIDIIKKRWDIDGGNPQNVEVIFKDSYDVINRVKEYLYSREVELIKTEDGYLYKDYIDGLNDFKKWIKSFGEDCIVLKPESLREELIKDYSLKLERYKKVINNEI